MKRFIRVLVVISILVGIGWACYGPVQRYIAERNKVNWRTVKVERGDIVAVVNSTGSVKPKLKVSIGSFVSGPIKELFAAYNQEVKKGDLLATIDPRLYDAAVARDQAALANREADVLRVKAQLQQAINDEKRALALREEDETFIAQSEMDKFKFNRLALDAQLKVSTTSVDQARATLDTSLANLNYTKIISPVDGMILERMIEPGQTLAAQFQTPVLFIIAPDLRKEMDVHASVDEADIGLIKQAQQHRYPVTFTVDAYPEELFEGTIHEIRLSFTTTQNVVTYPVVVTAPNPDLKLLPGMTASISFQVDERNDVVKIPNAALRFYPDAKHVRPEDIPILEGQTEQFGERDEEQVQQNDKAMSAAERSQRRRDRDRRHVWIVDGLKLRAVAVTTGLSDSQFTEMVDGTLQPSDLVVTGIKPPQFAPPR